MHFPHHGGFGGGIGAVFTDVIAGLVFIICFAVVVGLIFLLVRFLLVATKAAELYVARNSLATPPPTPTAPASTAAATTQVTESPSVTSATTPLPTKPTSRPRTPKTPPTS